MNRFVRARWLRGAAAVTAVTAVAACGLLVGCSKPLLSPTEERSPFDRYDAVRNRHAPQYVENEYGRRQPNLRGRLEPRN